MSDIEEILREAATDIGIDISSIELMAAADEIERLRAENEKLDDIRIDYICKINKLVDQREKLRRVIMDIINDVGYHNPMRMTTEISDKILEDALGALNDNI